MVSFYLDPEPADYLKVERLFDEITIDLENFVKPITPDNVDADTYDALWESVECGIPADLHPKLGWAQVSQLYLVYLFISLLCLYCIN